MTQDERKVITTALAHAQALHAQAHRELLSELHTASEFCQRVSGTAKEGGTRSVGGSCMYLVTVRATMTALEETIRGFQLQLAADEPPPPEAA